MRLCLAVFFRVKIKNISRPSPQGVTRASPVKSASLRLRLFHWAGRAKQEEDI